MNHKRRRQFISAFEWIRSKPLPVYAENERMCININVFKDYRVITLFNLSCDDALKPIIRYKPIGALKYLSKQGRLLPLKYTMSEDKLIADKKIKAFDDLIIVDERMK